MNANRILPLLVATLILAACSSPRQVAQYVPPSSTAPAASVQGLVWREKGLLFNGEVMTYVTAVDGKQVLRKDDEGSNPVRLAAGLHAVTLAYNHHGRVAQVSLPLNAKPQGVYTARAQVTAFEFMGTKRALLWIDDATSSTPVTEKVETDFLAPPPTTVIFIPGK